MFPEAVGATLAVAPRPSCPFSPSRPYSPYVLPRDRAHLPLRLGKLPRGQGAPAHTGRCPVPTGHYPGSAEHQLGMRQCRGCFTQSHRDTEECRKSLIPNSFPMGTGAPTPSPLETSEGVERTRSCPSGNIRGGRAHPPLRLGKLWEHGGDAVRYLSEGLEWGRGLPSGNGRDGHNGLYGLYGQPLREHPENTSRPHKAHMRPKENPVSLERSGNHFSKGKKRSVNPVKKAGHCLCVFAPLREENTEAHPDY